MTTALRLALLALWVSGCHSLKRQDSCSSARTASFSSQGSNSAQQANSQRSDVTQGTDAAQDEEKKKAEVVPTRKRKQETQTPNRPAKHVRRAVAPPLPDRGRLTELASQLLQASKAPKNADEAKRLAASSTLGSQGAALTERFRHILRAVIGAARKEGIRDLKGVFLPLRKPFEEVYGEALVGEVFEKEVIAKYNKRKRLRRASSTARTRSD